jgi:hypothetical protein
VLTKEIDPKTLVNLSHEDLASKEMAAALDALKKEGVKMVRVGFSRGGKASRWYRLVFRGVGRRQDGTGWFFEECAFDVLHAPASFFLL